MVWFVVLCTVGALLLVTVAVVLLYFFRMCAIVTNQQWKEDSTDVNILMGNFLWRLTGCADRLAPVKKLSLKDIKLRLKAWVTVEIRKLIEIRDRLFSRKKREPDNQTVKLAYNRVRNKVKNEIFKSKRRYQKSYFEKYKSDIKKTWEGIRKLVNVKNLPIFPYLSFMSKVKLWMTHNK